jgi:hypothetical protein
VQEQRRLADFRQKVVIVERTRKQRLTDIGWNGDVVAQHQVQLVGRGFPGEAHAQQRRETAYALLRICRKEAWHEAEEFGGDDRHRLVSAKFRNAINKDDTTDAILAVMTDIVEDHERSI